MQPHRPTSQTGSWSLNGDQTVLTATYPRVGPAYPDDITELSATTLRLRTHSGSSATLAIESTYMAF